MLSNTCGLICLSRRFPAVFSALTHTGKRCKCLYLCNHYIKLSAAALYVNFSHTGHAIEREASVLIKVGSCTLGGGGFEGALLFGLLFTFSLKNSATLLGTEI